MTLLVSALVDEVNDTWRSYVRIQEPVTSLTAGINATDLSFTPSDISKLGVGLVQIDDEMIQVSGLNRDTGVVSVEPWGRGQMSSTATTHATGAKVTASPTYPRVRVAQVVSGVLQEIFPQIFAVSSDLLTVSPAVTNYALNTDVYHVLSVSYLPFGPSGTWVPIPRWRQTKTPTTVEMDIMSAVAPGADRVRVFYIKNPPSQLVMTDDLQTLGYPTSIRDVIVLGACARLAAFTEASRVQTDAIPPAARSEAVPAGSAISLSRYLYQLFRQRLDDEANNMLNRYPFHSHFTR